MNLLETKNELIRECRYCAGTGYMDFGTCYCVLKFRAMQALFVGGYNGRLIQFASSLDYSYPEIVFGLEYLDWFTDNLEAVDKIGLGLYIFSRERGRGKTTIAHHLMYHSAYHFNQTQHYSRDRSYAFGTISELLEDKTDKKNSKYLVIDDLGNEDKSASWKREIVQAEIQRIVQKRRANNRVTIFTSNYAPEHISSLYGGYLDSLMEIRPDGSIGGELFRGVEVGGGEDLRIANDRMGWPI